MTCQVLPYPPVACLNRVTHGTRCPRLTSHGAGLAMSPIPVPIVTYRASERQNKSPEVPVPARVGHAQLLTSIYNPRRRLLRRRLGIAA